MNHPQAPKKQTQFKANLRPYGEARQFSACSEQNYGE